MKKLLPFLKSKHFSVIRLLNLQLLLVALSLFTRVSGQQAEIICDTVGCTAKDLQVDSVFLADAAGNIMTDVLCIPGNIVNDVWLRIKFKGSTSSPRYSLLTYFDLYQNDVFDEHIQVDCFSPPGGIIVGGYYNIRTINWICGSKVTLKNIYMSWQENSGQACSCGTSKCNFAMLPIVVFGPLFADFTSSPACLPGNQLPTFTFTNTTTGGKAPLSYDWDFGEGASPATATTSGPFAVNYSSGGTKTVTLTVQDSKGGITTAVESVNVVSCCNLQLTAAANDKVVDCNGSGNPADLNEWLNIHGGAAVTDAQGVTVSWTYAPADPFAALSDGCGATGSVTVTFTATDGCGFSVSTTASFIIRDNTPPIINNSAKNNLTIECDGTADPGGAIAAWLSNHAGATATDACSSVTWTNNYTGLSDLCGATGTTPVTFTAKDACNNTSTTSANVTIRDITPPLIDNSGKLDLTVDCDGTADPGGAIAAWLSNHAGATASDGCSSVTWTNNFTGLSDLCGATGTAPVTFTAKDACNNTSTTTANVTIRDITPPLINNSGKLDLTVECNGTADPGGAIAAWLSNHAGATVSDACSSVTWANNYTGLSDLCGATGTAPVTFTAKDACNNASTTTATVTIRDITPPIITVQASNSVVDCDGQGNTAALSSWLSTHAGAAATDACGGVTWSYSPNPAIVSDLCGVTGVVTVTFKATDDCGNSSTTSATFTIHDVTPPSITTPASDSTVECDGAGNSASLNAWLSNHGGAAASDVCSGVTWSDNFTALRDGCGATGSATVTFRATDACGQYAETTAVFKIIDTVPPVITCAANITIECPAKPEFPVPEASDQCDPDPVITFKDVTTPGTCPQAYSITRTWTATDACGNASSCQQKITVMDTTPPDLVLNTTCFYLSKYGTWAMNPSELQLITGNTTDNCSDFSKISFAVNPRTLGCDDIGDSKQVTVTATDECGNSVTGTVIISVKDTLKPVALCHDITRYLDKFGQTFIVPEDINRIEDHSAPEWAVYFNLLNGGSYDNCGISVMELDKHLFTHANIGTNTVTLSMSDPSNNLSYCTATVTVLDTIKHMLETVPNIVKNVLPGVCTTKIEYPAIKSKDGSLPVLEKVTGLGPGGDFPVGVTLETWKATFLGGVSVFTSFTVTVNTYNAAPRIGAVEDITVNEDAAKFDIQLSGINYGIDCAVQKVISLDVTNSNASLLTVTKDYTSGAASGKLTVMLKPGMSGSSTLTLTVRDNGGTDGGGIDTTTKTFSITVTPVNDPPTVTPIPDQVIVVPNAMSVNLVTPFKDSDEGDVLTFTVTMSDGSALPSWMTFNPSTGLLTGTPTAANLGRTDVKVTATDKAGAFVSDIFLVIVTNPGASTLHVTAVSGTTLLTGGFTVKLYAKDGNFFIPVEITPVFNAGTSTFYNLPDGTYLVKAIITDATINPGLLNTYYESSTSVTGAAQVVVNTAGTKTIRITMAGLTLTGGSYKISGIVVYKTGTPDMVSQGNDPVATPAPGIDLVLKQNGVVVANTVTGTGGKYSFTGLPAGIYDVFVEVPGFTQQVTQKVTLDASNPLKDKVDFTIWNSTGTHVITLVTDVNDVFRVNVYPNPTSGKVNVDLHRNGIYEVELTVYNIMGVVVFRNQYHTEDLIRFDLGKNATGIYLLKIRGEGRYVMKKITLDKR